MGGGFLLLGSKWCESIIESWLHFLAAKLSNVHLTVFFLIKKKNVLLEYLLILVFLTPLSISLFTQKNWPERAGPCLGWVEKPCWHNNCFMFGASDATTNLGNSLFKLHGIWMNRITPVNDFFFLVSHSSFFICLFIDLFGLGFYWISHFVQWFFLTLH